MNTLRPFLRTVALLASVAAAVALAQTPPATRADTRVSPPARSVVPIDRIVAVVNDDVIRGIELAERTQLVAGQLRRGGGQVPPADALQRQVLERMINDLVQVQMARESPASRWTTPRWTRRSSASRTRTACP